MRSKNNISNDLKKLQKLLKMALYVDWVLTENVAHIEVVGVNTIFKKRHYYNRVC